MLSLINPSELIRRFAASDGIDIAGLVKSEEELQAQQSQQQRVALEQQLADNATPQEQPTRRRRRRVPDQQPDKQELKKGSHFRPLPDGGQMIITDNFIR